MGIHQEKYTRKYFTGVDESGNPVGYGATIETDQNGLWQLREHDSKILAQVDFSEKRILDIGFGRGEAICYAYLNGAIDCVGVDFSEAAVDLTNELIEKRNLPKAELHQSDALQFINEYAEKYSNIEAKKFDVIIMLDFIEHVPRVELRKVLTSLRKIMAAKAIVAINTPAYKYDNDVIQNGYDQRNMEGCNDTSDIAPETQGMRCNKYSVISLQQFMGECSFINLTEAHFFVDLSIFNGQIEQLGKKAYSERWHYAFKYGVSLKEEYKDDEIEYPYIIGDEPKYLNIDSGNMSGLELLLTTSYQNLIFQDGNNDEEVYSSLKDEEINGKVVFDVGAFMGYSSLFFAKLAGPNGRVIAFEPNPWNRNRIFLNLSHNQGLDSKIDVYEYALSDKNEKTTMTMSSELDNGFSSTSRLENSHPKIRREGLPEGFESVNVDVKTLDWFVETYKIIPNVIKVDIEGAEHFFLRGSIKTINENKPVLYIELHSEFCALQCTLILRELGYIISVLKEEIDNRLMIKAVFNLGGSFIESGSKENKLLEIIGFQYETTIQSQKVYQHLLSDQQAFKLKIQNLNEQLAVLQLKYQQLQLEHGALNINRQDLQAQFDTLKLNDQNLQVEHDHLNTEFQKLQLEHGALNINRQDLQAQFDTLKWNEQNLQVEHDHLNTEFQNLQDKYRTLFSENQNSNAANEKLKDELQGVQAELVSILNSRSVRYAKKLKALLGSLGIKNT